MLVFVQIDHLIVKVCLLTQNVMTIISIVDIYVIEKTLQPWTNICVCVCVKFWGKFRPKTCMQMYIREFHKWNSSKERNFYMHVSLSPRVRQKGKCICINWHDLVKKRGEIKRKLSDIGAAQSKRQNFREELKKTKLGLEIELPQHRFFCNLLNLYTNCLMASFFSFFFS